MRKKDEASDKAGNNRAKVVQFEQKKFQQRISYGAMIVLAVIVVSFIAWPVLQGGFSASGNVRLGLYRGEPIRYDPDYGLFASNFQSLLQQFGVDSSSSDFERRSVFLRAFFATVRQYGRYFFLRDLGTDVSRKEANTLLYRQFVQEGRLDRAAWNRLQNDPNRLKNAQNIMIYAASGEIWEDIYSSVDLIGPKELELLVPTLGDMRKVSYLYYRISDYPESEVEEFYNANRELFQKQFLRRISLDSGAKLKKLETELSAGGNFGELAQLYSDDVYSQSKGEYGRQFYYELRDFFFEGSEKGSITQEQATEWTTQIFNLNRGEYAGPFQLGEKFFFFQLKTQAELDEEEDAQEASKEAEQSVETRESSFTAVASAVRSYIQVNELATITDYFRRNLEILKARAKEPQAVDGLAGIERGDLDANYNMSPEFFGFQYSGSEGGALYDSLASSFPEPGLATAIRNSGQFFEEIFSLEQGGLSPVMLLGLDETDPEQQYVAFFRLEESRDSSVNDFSRNAGDDLSSKQSLFNYYLNSLLTSGLELEFLNRKNLKQRFERAYQEWSSAQ